jgi:HK97 family phage prohead protease
VAKKFERRTFAFELRSGKPDGSYFEGHCAVFNSIDCYGTIMARGAFSRRLPTFMERGFVAGLNHDWDEPIGSPKSAQEDAYGLAVSAELIDTSHALDVRKLLAGKVCKYLSFGFEVMGRTYLENAAEVQKFWDMDGYKPSEQDVARSQYGAVVFTDINVFEFCPVMVPGNDQAEITGVRDGLAAERPTLDTLLRTGAATVEELCGAVERYIEMRSRDGNIPFQPERRALLVKMRDRLVRALTVSTPKADPAAVLALRRDLLALEVGLHKPRIE